MLKEEDEEDIPDERVKKRSFRILDYACGSGLISKVHLLSSSPPCFPMCSLIVK